MAGWSGMDVSFRQAQSSMWARVCEYDPRRLAKTLAATFLLAALAGCGVTYKPPSVREQAADSTVTVVALTSATVAEANRSAYTPRSLPEVFYAVAGSGSLRGTGSLPSSPEVPDQRAERAVLNPPPAIARQPYRIGVGDVVLLSTRSSQSTVEQLSGLLAAQNGRQGYTVRDDGAISIPEVGTVVLAGLTLEEAEDTLFRALVEQQIDPSFSIEIAEFRSQKIAVGGAVGRATLVPITLQPPTLGDALIAAEGLSVADEEFATIRIYRDGKLYEIPVDSYRRRPEFQNLNLQNGDAIFVDTTYDFDRAFRYFQQEIAVISLRNTTRTTALANLTAEIDLQRSALNERRENFNLRAALDAEPRDYVYLSGEVSNQARVPLPYGQHATLADVLFEEGGLKPGTGDPAEIYVLRANDAGDAITAYHLDAANVANLTLATRMEMRPNDIVFVEEQVITKWSRALQQLFPFLLNSAASGG